MLPTDSLEQKTLTYWNMSSSLNGRPSQTPKMTVQKLLEQTNDTMATLNPSRRISYYVWRLQEEIVMGSPKIKKKDRIDATILTLPLKAVAR